MDLHDLMGTAVADLPELPDQLPEVERIHRRRTKTRRATMVAASTALVLGVGTLTIASPWTRAGGTVNVSAGSGGAVSGQQFAEDAARTLQNIWPGGDAKVSWVRQSASPENISQYGLFRVEAESKTWQLHLIMYGASATTQYSPTAGVPTACIEEAERCRVSSNSTEYAYIPSDTMDLVYVYRGGMPIMTLSIQERPDLAGTSVAYPMSSFPVSPTPPPMLLSADQFGQLAMSDGMQQILDEAARAGLLGPAFADSTRPIPSLTP